MKKKPCKAKNIQSAERRVRDLMRSVEEWKKVANRLDAERMMLARLAATGPAFDNPLHIVEARRVCDELLAKQGLNPDGTYRSKQ